MRYGLLLFSLLFFVHFSLLAQASFSVTVQSGSASSDCTDPFGGSPDPLFAVSVQGGSFVYYPEESGCYTALPHLAFSQDYVCEAELPTTIEICLRVTENDALFGPPINCNIVETCTETICQQFSIPALNTSVDQTLTISAPGSTSGTVTVTLSNTGLAYPDNDLICDAIDLGVLQFNDTLGNATQGLYSNLCADNIGDFDPLSINGYFFNNAGVWFQFTTGPDPAGMIVVEGLSDPLNLGEPINLEMEVFASSDGTCTGTLQRFPNFTLQNADFNHEIRFFCPAPNTTYYILVDGAPENMDFQGIFGLQVWDVGIEDGGDLRCDAQDLGAVPEGGSVGTTDWVGNFCAVATGDPFTPAFVNQHSVWFSFIAPPSGHVLVEGISNTDEAPLGIQLAVYRPVTGTCTSFFSHEASAFTDADLDESLELTCLYPGRPYYILVDGSGSHPRGAFNLTVSDAGDITPVTVQDTVLCFGESLQVGPFTHNATGVYNDTLQVFRGCDSIVITNLTILDELTIALTQTQRAIGEGGANGRATAAVTGGSGNYTVTWCTGETGLSANTLVGGQECCVTVTDDLGCTATACIMVEFATAIIPTFANDTLACFDDRDGVLEFSASSGVPPYLFNWQNTDNSLSGSGSISTDGGTATITDLPAGQYTVRINDDYFDTIFVVQIIQPTDLELAEASHQDASCFRFCDGQVEVIASGGTPGYMYDWVTLNGQNALQQNLCAGQYLVRVTDANGCQEELTATITQPQEFIATAAAQEVSCFDGEDGAAEVSTNGQPTTWLWSNGQTTSRASNLASGSYMVTVTNQDGCMDTTGVFVPQPLAPLAVVVRETSNVSCFGFSDGALGTTVTGPYNTLTFVWNNGEGGASINGLPAGTYSVSVTSERGCLAEADYTLGEPTELTASVVATDINCEDGPNAGVLELIDVSGGVPGYSYAMEEGNFSPSPFFDGLTAGNYALQVRDAEGCLLALQGAVLPPPDLFVDILGYNGQPLPLGDELRLQAQATSDNVMFSWDGLDSLSGNVLDLQPTASVRLRVTALDTITRCRAFDEVSIIVDNRPRIFAPNIFTPNGDGNNERFMLFGGADVVAIPSLRIFSRSGQLVYEENNLLPGDISRGWNGQLNGQDLNPGVFVYFAEVNFLDGRTEIVKGDLTLIR